MSFKMIFFGLLAAFLSVSEGDAGATVTDAAPTEYSYAVRVSFVRNAKAMTQVGFVVSTNYIMTHVEAFNVEASEITITDQQGATQVAAKRDGIGPTPFAFIKVCNKFKAPFFNMSASSFYDRLTERDAELLFFTNASFVLKKTTVIALDNETCASKVSIFAALTVCMNVADKTDFCKIFRDASEYSYFWLPSIAVGGQVNGVLGYKPFCDRDDYGFSNDMWAFISIGFYRKDLINGLPDIVNQ